MTMRMSCSSKEEAPYCVEELKSVYFFVLYLSLSNLFSFLSKEVICENCNLNLGDNSVELT